MTERFTVEVNITAKDKTADALNGVKRGFRGAFDEVVTGAMRRAGEVALGFVQQLPAMAIDLTKLGIAAQATERRFTQFAGGAERAAMFLNAFQEGTGGTVDKMSAMQSAAKLLQMGLVDSGDEMSTVAAIATKLGDQTMDAGSRIADFAALLANQSIPRLDNFGISSGRVRERIDELIKSGQALNREQAFKMAVMEEGAKALDTLGDTSDTAAEKMAVLTAAVQDAKLGFAEMAVSAVEGAGGVETIADRIRGLPDTLGQTLQYLDAIGDGIQRMGEGNSIVRAATNFQEGFTDSLQRSVAATIDWKVASEEVRYAYTQQAKAADEGTEASERSANAFQAEAKMGDFVAQSIERQALAAEESRKAQEIIAQAADRAAIAQAGLAANLKDATDAQIAQTAISQLGVALENGEISLETYTTAVTETQLAFGLADEQSIFLTESLGGLTEALADGSLKATDYDEALGAVIQESMAAGVEVGVFNDALNDLPKKVEVKIITKYETVGHPPSAISNNIPEMQAGSMFAPGGLTMVGERGPEMTFLPRGAAVYPTDMSRHIQNNFNLNVETRASSMGVQNEFFMMQGMAG